MDTELHIPEEFLVGHWTVDEDAGVPHKVHVFLLHTKEQVRKVAVSPPGWNPKYEYPIDAQSHAFRKADADNYRGWIILSVEDLWPGLLAHEALHLILGWEAHRRITTYEAYSSKWWLEHHPERVAELLGNLTQCLINTLWPWIHKPEMEISGK